MTGVERRLRDLEARLASIRPWALPALPDGLELSALSDLAVDVLEWVTREWPSEHLPAGLCAAVAAACARPPAERVMAVGMVLARYWPEASGDPMELMAALTSSGLLPGAADDPA